MFHHQVAILKNKSEQRSKKKEIARLVTCSKADLPEIASVHAGPEDNALTQAELLHHIMLDSRCSGGCECHQWHLGVPIHCSL